jgi:hypothetical protein
VRCGAAGDGTQASGGRESGGGGGRGAPLPPLLSRPRPACLPTPPPTLRTGWPVPARPAWGRQGREWRGGAGARRGAPPTPPPRPTGTASGNQWPSLKSCFPRPPPAVCRPRIGVAPAPRAWPGDCAARPRRRQGSAPPHPPRAEGRVTERGGSGTKKKAAREGERPSAAPRLSLSHPTTPPLTPPLTPPHPPTPPPSPLCPSHRRRLHPGRRRGGRHRPAVLVPRGRVLLVRGQGRVRVDRPVRPVFPGRRPGVREA